jgi:hypothetical protein
MSGRGRRRGARGSGVQSRDLSQQAHDPKERKKEINKGRSQSDQRVGPFPLVRHSEVLEFLGCSGHHLLFAVSRHPAHKVSKAKERVKERK